jgi:hypothetical protein
MLFSERQEMYFHKHRWMRVFKGITANTGKWKNVEECGLTACLGRIGYDNFGQSTKQYPKLLEK